MPKTALAGVILETSFAMFKASINAFNAETVSSCSLGCWVLGSIVKTGGRIWMRGDHEARRKWEMPRISLVMGAHFLVLRQGTSRSIYRPIR